MEAKIDKNVSLSSSREDSFVKLIKDRNESVNNPGGSKVVMVNRTHNPKMCSHGK